MRVTRVQLFHDVRLAWHVEPSSRKAKEFESSQN